MTNTRQSILVLVSLLVVFLVDITKYLIFKSQEFYSFLCSMVLFIYVFFPENLEIVGRGRRATGSGEFSL